LRPGASAPRPGDVVTTTLTAAAPHHLIADAPLLTHRLTRAGDAHLAGRLPHTIGLGLPAVGAPFSEPRPTTTGCLQ
jgi:tRNA-2-methylthio-N6-dimethylallyladenosine synthase